MINVLTSKRASTKNKHYQSKDNAIETQLRLIDSSIHAPKHQ